MFMLDTRQRRRRFSSISYDGDAISPGNAQHQQRPQDVLFFFGTPATMETSPMNI
jgi:hypothetical protein